MAEPLNDSSAADYRTLSIAVAQHHKFAIIALPNARTGECPAPLVHLPTPFAATRGLPATALATWQHNIGQFHRDELEQTTLFLWAVRPSAHAEVLDAENRALSREVYRLYLGLLLAVPYFCAGRPTLVTGANADGEARARSLTTYQRTWFTLGAPKPHLSTGKLKLAATIAAALSDHDAFNGKRRIERALRTFRQACESGDLDFRLHQFVRCAEGFAVPPFKQSGKQFTKRLARICAGRCTKVLEQLYTIRGGIEHLHGPFDRLPQYSHRRRHRLLLQRCVQAEAFARYLLVTYFQHPALWTHFADRPSVDAFWALRPAKLKELWPTRIAFDRILDQFEHESVDSYIEDDD
jgi:hypothetical protein